MSVLISGKLVNGAGEAMAGCHIILKARVNTSEVIMRTTADVIAGENGEYAFNAQIGRYCVYLRRCWCEDEYCVGDILVDEDSKPGTLNDFLIAPGESDLKPDVVKRFEELLAATQASAAEAAGSASSAGQSANAATSARNDAEQSAAAAQQSARSSAGNATEAANSAASAAGSATAAAASATAAAQAKSDIDAEMADALKAVTSSRSDALQAAEEARRSSGSALVAAGNAQQSAEDALRSGNQAAAQASRAKQSADNAAVSEASALASQNAAEQSAQASRGYRDSAQQIVNGLNDTNASLTEKGLVQLSSATDSESESLAATPKAVRAVMDAVQTKAPLESPALSGTPTTPTPPDGATGNEIANAAFVRTLISALVGSSPEALDTLNELAAALGNDPNFATTVTKALAGKQPLSDVLSSLSGLASSPDKLPYFSDRNVMALANLTATGRELIMQNSRSDVLSYLGVKSAGTKDVQQDIYDRTEGRVALPGAFGYGHAFSAAEKVLLSMDQEVFIQWVKNSGPGRYAVEAPAFFITTEAVSGEIEIISPSPTEWILYFRNGVYFKKCHITDNGNALIPLWEDVADKISALYSTTGNSYGSPGVGGLMLAAYCGESDEDTQRKLWRGRMVSGSRLSPVTLTGGYNSAGPWVSTPQITVMSPVKNPQVGAFIALSGSDSSTVSKASSLIGLFMRVA